jgi:hypothetical protein
MNELTTLNTSVADPFLLMAQQEDTGSGGTILKFRQGLWETADGVNVPLGTLMLALCEDTRESWVRWKDKMPAESHTRFIRDGIALPMRCELGNHDETQWETDPATNKKIDPWSLQRYLDLVDCNTNTLYTWIITSKGARSAWGSLLRSYSRVRHMGLRPVVSLCTDSYKNKTYGGRTQIPVLKIERFEADPAAPVAPALPAPTPRKADPISSGPVKTVVKVIDASELNDDINDAMPY